MTLVNSGPNKNQFGPVHISAPLTFTAGSLKFVRNGYVFTTTSCPVSLIAGYSGVRSHTALPQPMGER